MDTSAFNLSHQIHQLSFGDHFPGIINPLDATHKIAAEGGGVYQYYVKVVRTTYHYLTGHTIVSNQYSVTEHSTKTATSPENSPFMQGRGLPGVFFFYDISPIMVQFSETRRSFFHFLTQLCAIIGGVFTVAGIIDRVVFATVRQIEKKIQPKFN
eukprot:TRINITY_DN3077_c0_g1_i8.p1 TRINITY_DN3077_c0_g1~~TRINITY_DN3077_c0_g1_i8.p1  ORF type:complete len:155 (+),score=23.45 TRINITY_DN3077_c0_g1_i8:346-810(+)